MVPVIGGHVRTNTANIKVSEQNGINDPLIQSNLNYTNGTIIQEQSNARSVINFLEKYKETIEEFDYRVLYTVKGIHTELRYISARMIYQMLCYGNIMFLDGQKRRYNRINWSCIGPVIKNNCDNGICVVGEAIITSENMYMYTWIFKSNGFK